LKFRELKLHNDLEVERMGQKQRERERERERVSERERLDGD
jgi:hypothetical protein